MAEIKYFLFCEGVQNVPDPKGKGTKTTVQNPLMTLTPPFIPGAYSFSITLGIQGINQSAGNKLQIILKDPLGNILQDTGTVELPVAPKGNLPPKYIGISLSMDYRNLIINSEGEYTSTIIYNGTVLGTYKIPVIKRSSDKK